MRRKRPSRLTKPSWLWRWHHLISVFVFFFGIGMALAYAQYGIQKPFSVRAASADNMRGWLWADPIGWISLNDLNPSACSGAPCGTYGVNVSSTTRDMEGFAWNDDAGWICFGASCAVGACNGGVLPNTPPPGGTVRIRIDPLGATSSTPVEVRGWAKVCNQPTDGWISFNCSDFVGPPAACTAYNYRVQYVPSTKLFTANTPPPFTSLAWNGNLSGTGFGYIDFSRARLATSAENIPVTQCRDGIDNDFNGSIDCADPACRGVNLYCDEDPGTLDLGGRDQCNNGIDDDADGAIDCADTTCSVSTNSYCNEVVGNTNAVRAGYALSGIPMCADSIDNDGDTDIDCGDLGCSGYVAPPGSSCGVLPPANTEPACGYAPFNEESSPGVAKTPAQCCTDGINNDASTGNTQTDCNDSACQANVIECTPAWLQTRFGNIYAQQGIAASSSPFIVGQNATYCLSTLGTVTGFTSQTGCIQSGTQGRRITLPKGGTQNYQGTLGKIDIEGILAGQYGTVQTIAGSISFATPTLLNGRVYHVLGSATMGATSFSNGTTQTARGNGLLLIQGGDLTITGNNTYTAVGSLTYLRNLASFGVIVTKNAAGTSGGNIIVQPAVTQLVGAYFAEGAFSTGTACPSAILCPSEQALTVSGLVAARQMNFQRNYRDPNIPAESVVFDGRAIANPPPGMSDISKSLPVSADAF